MHPGQVQYREVIARFLASFSKEHPWYYSLHKKSKANDDNQTLFQALGLTNKAGISLCKAAGLMTIRIVKGHAVVRVEHEQWRNFIRDSGLSGETDYNPTQLNKKGLVFINLGNKNIQPERAVFHTTTAVQKGSTQA
jgi:hypothetical protein